MITNLLAWSGALLSCLLSVPQLVRALRSEHLCGVSEATYWLVLGNAGVWAGWAVLTEQYAAGVPALVNGPAAVLIIARVRAARCGQRRDPTTARLPQRAGLHLPGEAVGPRGTSPQLTERLHVEVEQVEGMVSGYAYSSTGRSKPPSTAV